MKTKKWLMVSLLLGIAWGAVGCQKVDSTDVRTSGVYAEFIVTEHSTTEANVDATLWVGALSNTYLELTGPDRLTAYVGSNAYPMQDTRLSTNTIPRSFLTSHRHGTARGVRTGPRRCRRAGLDRDRPGALRAGPAGQDQYSRANDTLEIDWAPFDPTQLVSWLASGACVEGLGEDSAVDAGRVAIPAGTLKKPPMPGPDEEHHPVPPDECTANADVTKSRDGHVDLTFSGGTFKASQERSVTFTPVP